LIRPRRWRGHQPALGIGFGIIALSLGALLVFGLGVFERSFRGEPRVVGRGEFPARPRLGLLSLCAGRFLPILGGELETDISGDFLGLQAQILVIDGGFWRSGGVCPISGVGHCGYSG
jgi:hypothetical protein